VQIEELYGMPMDIEWAWADGRFAIVQARPITALPEPVAPAPSGWPLPDPKGQYMRASITELTPDPLTPLYATLGLSAIDRGINVMAQDLLHMPEDTFKGFLLTINGYFYEKVRFTGRQWWLMLTRMIPSFPRMLREGVPYWRDVARPRYVETAARWRGKPLSDLSAAELLQGVCELMDAFAFHLGALMGSTMGPSAGSEGLFTRVYEKMVMRPGEPTAPTFLMGFDSLPIKGEKALFDLALWCRERPALASHLTHAPTAELAARWDEEGALADVPVKDWHEWQGRFREYLDRYGYSIYDMDFSKPLPMDEPTPILETLKLFITGQGKSPYERQQAYAERREQAVRAVRARLKGLKRWAFEKTLKWAQSQAPLREDGIAEIGLGYPALRQMLRELGRRLAEAGAIQQSEDIYWLEEAEIEALVAALERGEALAGQAEAVRERKALWQARKRLTPPPMLPLSNKYLGINMDSLLASRGEQLGDTLKGVGASAGRVTAAARVLHGPEDFAQMRPGDILVASITTPAWTPLFAMAAGVVTDIGGPLSHGSIVAREYGIPAVLGTGVATKRIRSGQTITVDGSAGIVTLAHDA
jgi:pyruvate,water dikinase